jgi:hypothetical protein
MGWMSPCSGTMQGFDRLGESKCSAHQNTSLRNLLPVHNPTQKSYSGEHLPWLSITLYEH